MESQTGCMKVPTFVTLLSFNTARLHQPVLKGKVFILLINLFLLRTLEPSCVTLQQGLLMVESDEICAAIPVAILPVLQKGACLSGCSRGCCADESFLSAVVGGVEIWNAYLNVDLCPGSGHLGR